jgi:hypothetical protein
MAHDPSESVVDRAFAAAAGLEYGGAETRALLRLALDADHETGENCVTGLARVHAAAGYADDGGRYRTARRTIARFIADGSLRLDFEVAGIGRLFTVCPLGPWSGSVSSRTLIGRKLAKSRERTPDVKTSGVAVPTPDTTPDTTPDVKTSGDQRTYGPTTSLTRNGVEGRASVQPIAGSGEGETVPNWNNLVEFKRVVA